MSRQCCARGFNKYSCDVKIRLVSSTLPTKPRSKQRKMETRSSSSRHHPRTLHGAQ